MPFTPFHFGPGLAMHSAAPKHVSFLAFCAANVLIDTEPLYFMLRHERPVHRFMHSFVGATLVALVTVALFLLLRALARRFPLPNWFRWQELGVRPVAIGAFLGTYSHVVLDGLMHPDLRPFHPFSRSNPLLHLMSYQGVVEFCIVAGIAGAALLAVRRAN